MVVQSGSLLTALCPAFSGLEGGLSCVYMSWQERQGPPVCLFPKQGSEKTLVVLDLGPQRVLVQLSAEGILAWKFSTSGPQMAAPKQWLGDCQCHKAGT